MTATLAARLAGRPGEDRLLQAPDGALTVAEALAAGPSALVTPGACVGLAMQNARTLAAALVALDGQVAALLLLPAAADAALVARLMAEAGATLLVSDRADLPGALAPAAALAPGTRAAGGVATDWLMTSSGTTGAPKVVRHALAGLSRTVRTAPVRPLPGLPLPGLPLPVWGLLFDMTRFAGLQVALQAMLGNGVLAVPEAGAPIGRQLAFLAAAGCTHLSASPSLWRRILMHPDAGALGLVQATLGGEIADQAILDALVRAYPAARVTHIYASTEAGVGFAVNDRQAGFPAAWLQAPPADVGLKLADGLLWLRLPGQPPRCLGEAAPAVDEAGFVCSHDRVRIEGGRVLFLGRAGGGVNIGGTKVFPEQVEQLLLALPEVAAAQVVARPSPIMGNLLAARVVPKDAGCDQAALKALILARCRAALPREAVPASLSFAAELATTAAGKIARAG